MRKIIYAKLKQTNEISSPRSKIPKLGFPLDLHPPLSQRFSLFSLNLFIHLGRYFALVFNCHLSSLLMLFNSYKELRRESFYIFNLSTYPAPAVGEETLVLGPVAGIHVKHARRHDEDPNGEIDGVQHIVEHQGLLHARRH